MLCCTLHYTTAFDSTSMTHSSPTVTIYTASDTQALIQAKRIFEAYGAWLEEHFEDPATATCLKKQHFDEEFNTLPGRYAPPSGDIMLASLDGVVVGAIAFYALSTHIAELKRFYVLPHAAGCGIGKALFDAALHMTKSRGYLKVRLDTLRGMTHARALYARYDFHEIPAYNENYLYTPDLLYLELDLSTI